MERMAQHFGDLLAAICKSTDFKLSQLDFAVDPVERQLSLGDPNAMEEA